MGTVGCYSMLINAEKTLARALTPLAGYISELSVVDTGSTDGTVELVRQLAADVLKVPLHLQEFSPKKSPWFYFADEPQSFDASMPGPFTGAPILANWSLFFNLALAPMRAPYAIRVDADDVVVGGDKLPAIARFLDDRSDLNIIRVPYEIWHDGKVATREITPRIFRRGHVFWHWVLHEQVRPRKQGDEIWIGSGLELKDMNDSPGKIRIAHRNAKVLYREFLACESGLRQSPGPLFTMTVGHEMIKANPSRASEILNQAVGAPGMSDLVTGSDLHFHLGHAAERQELFGTALNYYTAAISREETANALIRRAIVRCKLGGKNHFETHSDIARAELLARQRDNLNVYLPWLAEARALVAG